MAESITELILRLGVEGAENVVGRFTELNQTLEVFKKGIHFVREAANALFNDLERGEAVNNVSSAFKRLQEQAGRTAEQGIGRLREATQGMLSDFELMQRSNLAQQLGITSDQFEQIARSAEALGEQFGKGLPESLSILTEGFGRAQDRALKFLGVNIDVEKAENDFAAALGKTREQLSELGKQEAFRIAALEQIKAASAAVSNENVSAADAYSRASAALTNFNDRVKAAIERNPQLAQSLEDVADAISHIDASALATGIADIGAAAAKAAGLVADFARGLDYVFKLSNTSKIASLDSRIASIQGTLGDRSTFGEVSRQISVALGGSTESELKNQLATLQKEREELFNASVAAQKFAGAQTEVRETTRTAKDALADHGKALFDEGDAAKKAAEEAAKLNLEYEKMVASFNARKIGDALQQSFDSLNRVDFERYNRELVEATVAAEIAGSTDPRVRVQKLAEAQYDAQVRAEAFAKAEQEKIDEAFRASTDYFADILNDLFSGDGLDIEGLVTEQLKNAAVEFGSELLAQLTNSFSGFGGTGGFGNIISSFIGQYLGLGPSSNIGPVANGAQYGNMLSGANALSSVSIAQVAGIAAGAAVAYLQYDTANQIFSGRASSVDDLNAPNRATLAYSTFGFSELARLFGVDDNLLGLLGLSTDKNTLTRRAFRGQLQQTGLGDNLTFNTTTGSTSLFNSDYALRNRTSLTDSAIGLVNPIAALFSGGDLKKQSDFAGIFADAVDNGKDFASVLINVSSLLDKMGVSAEEAANQLKDSFLDQIGGAEQFLETLRGFRIIAAEDLPSVADALGGIGNEFETNRAQLKRLELAFKEFGQIGITSAEGIHDYLVANYPDLVDVFDQLAQQGIDTWEEIANATPEMIGQIIRILEGLPESVGKVFIKAGDAAADGFESGASRVITKIRNIQAEIQTALSLQGALEDGGDAGAGGGSSSSRGSGGVHLIQPRSMTRGRNAGGVDENPRLARVS